MKNTLRVTTLFCAIVTLTTGYMAAPALAATHHKHHTKHHKHVRKASHTSSMTRTAQRHLQNLGYYKGSVDGISGPKTTAAIKTFQRDHHLTVNGKLTTSTYNAIVAADIVMPVDKLDGLHTVISSLQTRYAKIDVREIQQGPMHNYEIVPDGKLLYTIVEQPSPLDVSPVYPLPTEDAVVFSAYRPNNTICPYTSYLLITDATQSRLMDIDNCTRGYHVETNNGSLLITFPESENAGPIGSTWRYENGHLDRL